MPAAMKMNKSNGMVMNKRRVYVICFLVFVLSSIGVSIWLARGFFKITNHTGQTSAWGAIETSLYVELSKFYQNKGCYPETLEELRIEYSDGAPSDMLGDIEYNSDKDKCSFSYTRKNLRGEDVLIKYDFSKEKVTYSEFVNSKLVYRDER